MFLVHDLTISLDLDTFKFIFGQVTLIAISPKINIFPNSSKYVCP